MQSVIQTDQLTKHFKSTVAIDQVTIEIMAGQRVAIVGQPGAGKSTLLRLLVDLIHPTSGRARVAGFDTRQAGNRVRRAAGWVPSVASLPSRLTVGEHLSRVASFRRRDPDLALRQHVLPRLDMQLDEKIADLDAAERHVVAMLAVFERSPDVVLLDEPLSGLGPHKWVLDEMIEASAPGISIVATARDLSIAEHLMGPVMLLDTGRITATGTLDALRRKARQRTELRFGRPPDQEWIESLPGVLAVAVQGTTARVLSAGDRQTLLDAANERDLDHVVAHETTLSELLTDYRVLASRSS